MVHQLIFLENTLTSFLTVLQLTGFIDYDEVLRIAKECKPKMIIAGATAYARTIDFKKFREIC